ncbi:MAG: putative bifunctional diguanylate cyclase/phosphodiesterase [Sphingobium sp.]
MHWRTALIGICAGCLTAFSSGIGIWFGTATGLEYYGKAATILLAGLSSGLFAWRATFGREKAVDFATGRLMQAASGDLQSDVPEDLTQRAPGLARAMQALFAHTRADLENAQTMAMVDPVTGLVNRAAFRRQVEPMLARQHAHGPAVMMFIDLDGFKGVNDRMGHAAGDHILMKVAGRLREVASAQSMMGAEDAVIGRFAGDEFTIFMPSLPPELPGMSVARAIQQAFDSPFDLDGTQVDIGASIGVAYHPEHGATLSALLRSADHAMYDAKHGGRRQVRLYSRELELRIAARVELERDLRRALEQNEFHLQFQPQIDFSTGKVLGAEVLVRWTSPSRGIMLPASFVPLAQETGLMVELGEWIVDSVCETASRWAAAGRDQRLSINISPRELVQPNFFKRFVDAMARHGTPAAMLELELSESLAMKLDKETLDALTALRALGVHIAIDNFGTGYSNLSRLRDMPVDRIKIDRSLVRDIAVSDEARIICSAIVGLVRGLGFKTVVEGVETEAQVALLRVMGCDVLQGFHLSYPVGEEDYLARFDGSQDGNSLGRAASA